MRAPDQIIACRGRLYAHPMCQLQHFSGREHACLALPARLCLAVTGASHGGSVNPAPTIRFEKVCSTLNDAVYRCRDCKSQKDLVSGYPFVPNLYGAPWILKLPGEFNYLQTIEFQTRLDKQKYDRKQDAKNGYFEITTRCWKWSKNI